MRKGGNALPGNSNHRILLPSQKCMGKNFDGAAPGPGAAANGVCTCKYFYVESETSSVSMHQLLFCRCPNKLGKFIKTNYCENDE